MSVNIPNDMSAADVFAALYEDARVSRKVNDMGKYQQCAGLALGSRWNAVQVFQNFCHNGYCDYVRGKYMKVSFHKFPELNVKEYDEHYGRGSAQEAVDSFQKTRVNLTREEYDLKSDPCTYFTPYWEKKTP